VTTSFKDKISLPEMSCRATEAMAAPAKLSPQPVVSPCDVGSLFNSSATQVQTGNSPVSLSKSFPDEK